jgi:hypothetical protein
MDYILYCDESEKEGRFFSNFYGGALISGKYFNKVNTELNDKKLALNLHGEVKWQKVTPNYLQKYMDIIDLFFEYVKSRMIKIRIMFSQNCRVPVSLTREQRENAYFLLYYQFIKHAFGFQYCNNCGETIYLKPYFDILPDTKEKCDIFKEYILKLQQSDIFKTANILIRKEDIAEVVSHDHVILQCVDIILGAMFFRLNDFHLEKPEGSKKRGKRTIAKEQLYKHILRYIREIYPGFNIGKSTGTAGCLENRWNHPYRHWLFEPKQYKMDFTRVKSKK